MTDIRIGIGLVDILDMALMSVLVYSIMVWFKRTRAAFVLTGIVILGLIYLAARGLGMSLTTWVFHGFFAVFLIAMIIIFQEELRHIFERIAIWSLDKERFSRFPWSGSLPGMSSEATRILVRALVDLSRERIGALIVIKGKDPLGRHIYGGTELYGKLSESLLKSIFDPSSMGHDGAVVIDQGRIIHFSCQLPLSKTFDKLRSVGTRHAAALGLAELTDALCLVSSEERGRVSVARNGELWEISDLEGLGPYIDNFFRETQRPNGEKRWHDFLRKNTWEKVLALAVTFALWFVFVRGAVTMERSYIMRVHYKNVAEDLLVKGIIPDSVRLTFSGPERAFYFVNPAEEIKVILDLFGVKIGRKVLEISKENIIFPKSLSLDRIEPPKVNVMMRRPSRVGGGPVGPPTGMGVGVREAHRASLTRKGSSKSGI